MSRARGICSGFLLLLAVPAIAQIVVSPPTLPAGQLNLPYSATLTATGGLAPYTFAVVEGSLPAGLTMSTSGGISGTITGGGQEFLVRVQDSTDLVGFADRTIDVCGPSKEPATDNQAFIDTGGSGGALVNNVSACGALSAGSSVPWISITSTSNNSLVNFSVASNTTPVTRTGTIVATYNSAPVSPVNFAFTVTQYATLKFTTASPLPAAAAGQPYAVTFQATGGSNLNRSFLNATETMLPGLSLIGPSLSGTPSASGDFLIRVLVQDQNAATLDFFSTAKDFILSINPALAFTSTTLPDAVVGTLYLTKLTASGGFPPYSFSLSGTLPKGLAFDSNAGTISGKPAVDTDDLYPLTIQVKDAGVGVVTLPVTLRVNPVPLTIQNSSLAPAAEGVPYNVTFTATGGTPPYSWIAVSLPSWLNLTSTGQLSGTPPAGSASTYTISVNVQDSAVRVNSAILKLQVNPSPLAIVTTSPLADAKETTSYSVTFEPKGGKAPYTWFATGLPSFLKMAANGVLSGTPPSRSAGSYTFTASLSDTSGTTVTGTFTVKVNPLIAITTSSPLPQATESKPYSAAFNASGGTSPYKWSASGLPSWATLSADGSLTGTPPRGSAGGFAFNVTVTDSTGISTTAQFSLVVLASDGGLTVTTPSPLAGAAVGNYYQATLTATGGTPPFKWVGASVPDGLTLGVNGLLSGTPTTPGNLTVTAQVTDAKNNIAFGALNLLIAPAKLTVATPSPLAVGQLTVPYTAGFQSSGGARPTVWSISAGSLPSGLTLDPNGNLVGTPSATGDFNFTVRVTDTSGNTVGTGTAAAPEATPSTESSSYELLIKPLSADLVMSAASLAFSAVRGGPAPPSQTVSVITSARDSAAFSAAADAPWLSAVASGTTPGRIDVSVDQNSLTAGTYSGTITVTSPNRNPLSIKVTLTVSEAPAILQVSPGALQFFSDGTVQVQNQSLLLHNTGQGTLDFTASSDASWLRIAPASGTVTTKAGVPLIATVNVQGLTPGTYLGTIEIDSPGGVARIPVSLLVSSRPKLLLSSTGILLQARQGSGVSGPSPSTFQVSSSSTSINFAVQQIGGSDWLTLSATQGTAAGSTPATVSFQIKSAALAKGVYYALLRVTAPEPFNSPQDFVVVLNVLAAATAPVPDPVPSGLVFSAAAGPTPPTQKVTVFTSSDQSAPFQIAVNSSGWLSATPLAGSIATGTPAQLTVSVNAANLSPGIYTGAINISISNLSVRTVGVTLIVPGAAKSSVPDISPAAAPEAGCTPANLVLTQTGLAGNFSTPAAWPRTVAVQLSDDCGNPVTTGRALVEFSNGDAPLALSLSDAKSAVYSTTWTPVHSVSQLTVTAQATATGLNAASAKLAGAVSDSAAPILAKNGTVHNLYPQAGAALAPGTIVAIFGSALAATTSISNVPLPTVVNGTSVLIGGELAPIFFTSSGQINAQLPIDLVPGQEYQVIVVANTAYTTPDTIRIAPVTPGIARFDNGQVIAQHADFSLVTQQSPAKPAEFLVVYLAGMGLTSTPVATGDQSPSSPLANVSAGPTITLDGKPVSYLFAGLTPGFVGLYQINFQVPGDVRSGNLKLEISQSGTPANVSVLPVQ